MSAFNRRKIPSATTDALLVDYDFMYQEVCKLIKLLRKHRQPDAAILLKEPIDNMLDRKTYMFHRIDCPKSYFYIRSTPCEPFILNPLNNHIKDFYQYHILSAERLKRLLEHYTGDPIYVVLPESNVEQIQFRPIIHPITDQIEYVLLERKED